MSAEKNNFQSHEVHEILNNLIDYMHENSDTSNKKSSSNLARLNKILIKTRAVIRSIDPDFYPANELDKIRDMIMSENIITQVTDVIRTNASFDYQLANPELEELTRSVYILSGMSDKNEEMDKLKKLETSIARRHQTYESEFINLKLALENELEETREKINRIRSLEKELQDRSLQAKETLENNLSMLANDRNSRMSEFSKEQAMREEIFKNQSNEIIKMISSSAEKAYSSQEETIKQKTNQLLEIIEKSEDDIKSKHQSIKDIHELVAEDGIAGGYKKNAEDEKRAANMWRWITLGCYSLIIIWVLFKNRLGFETFINNEAQWPVLAITISITAIALIAANFSSKQSRIHAANEHKMRWFALEVKAIDPFISSLPEPERTELKRQLSEKLFCQTKNDEAINQPDKEKSLDTLSKVVTTLNETIQSLTKK